MWLFLAFLTVPLIEIALFIKVGGIIGLGWTLAIVVITAVIGTLLVRSQGSAALNNLRGSFSRLEDPTEPLAHGAMILFAGALLLTPGFFTDLFGFALLMPPVRAAVLAYLRQRIKVQRFDMGGRTFHSDVYPRPRGQPTDVIEGEFREIDPEKRSTHRPSGWTKH